MLDAVGSTLASAGPAEGPSITQEAKADGPRGARHFMLFKPDCCLSQFVLNGSVKLRAHQRLLSSLPSCAALPAGVMAVGRLDEDSEGLLLLTTDGALSYEVTSGGCEKAYYALLEGTVGPEALVRLRAGVDIHHKGDTYRTLPCEVAPLPVPPALPPRRKKVRDSRQLRDGTIVAVPTTWVSIVLRQGRNRQIRKMTAEVGHPTLRLVRVRVGDTLLGDMAPGELWPWNPGTRTAMTDNGTPPPAT